MDNFATIEDMGLTITKTASCGPSELMKFQVDASWDATKTRMIRLNKELEGHPALFTLFANRVRAMSKRLSGNHEALYQGVWDAFGRSLPTHAFYLIKPDHEPAIGHVLADIRQVSGEWIGYVIQEEIDVPEAISKGLIDEVIADLTAWLQQSRTTLNLPITRLVMETFKRSQAWVKRYGFTEHSTIYQRRIP